MKEKFLQLIEACGESKEKMVIINEEIKLIFNQISFTSDADVKEKMYKEVYSGDVLKLKLQGLEEMKYNAKSILSEACIRLNNLSREAGVGDIYQGNEDDMNEVQKFAYNLILLTLV